MAYIRSGRPAQSRRGVTFVPGGLACAAARRFTLSLAPVFLKPLGELKTLQAVTVASAPLPSPSG